MDVDAGAPLVSVASFGEHLRVIGQGRGGKPKEEDLRPSALAAHIGRRARKGRRLEGFPKPMKLVPL
jgi:topoisomerase-4 subunit A